MIDSDTTGRCRYCTTPLTPSRACRPWPACSHQCLQRLLDRGDPAVAGAEHDATRLWNRTLAMLDNPHEYGLTAAEAAELQEQADAEIERCKREIREGVSGPRKVPGKDADKESGERIGRAALSVWSGRRWNGITMS